MDQICGNIALIIALICSGWGIILLLPEFIHLVPIEDTDAYDAYKDDNE